MEISQFDIIFLPVIILSTLALLRFLFAPPPPPPPIILPAHSSSSFYGLSPTYLDYTCPLCPVIQPVPSPSIIYVPAPFPLPHSTYPPPRNSTCSSPLLPRNASLITPFAQKR